MTSVRPVALACLVSATFATAVAACGANVPLGSGSDRASGADAGAPPPPASYPPPTFVTPGPCAGLSLPVCPPPCPGGVFDACGKACFDPGATCGTPEGDGRTCANGTWQCRFRPPPGPGCNLVCKPATDPCEGVPLPPCPPQCPDGVFDACGKPCTEPGATCGTADGDGRTCKDGVWECHSKPPPGPGCNLVCRPPPDPCAGVVLPPCPPPCAGPVFGSCGKPCPYPGETCGWPSGDIRVCEGGVWACKVHPPAGAGCNRVCQPQPDPCADAPLPPCPPACLPGADQMCGKPCDKPGPLCVDASGDAVVCQGDVIACVVHPPPGPGCNLVCKPPADPCAGKKLPRCLPPCPGGVFGACGKPCAPPGALCGNAIGDFRVCQGGAWKCTSHDPAKDGCGLVCAP